MTVDFLNLTGALMPAWALPLPHELLDTRFWSELYATGRIGSGNDPNLIVLILVRLAVVVLIFVAASVVSRLLHRVVKRGLTAIATRTAHGHRRLNTLNGLLNSALSYLIYFIAIVLVLFTMGITWKALAPFLGLASVIGLAIGFGSQQLVRDLVSGLFILGEGLFDVGDWITIGDVFGQVEEMGWRVTRLRDEQGRLYMITNGDITRVFNASRGSVKVTIDTALQLAPRWEQQLQQLREMVEQALREQEIDVDPKRIGVQVMELDAAKVTIRLTAWVPVDKRGVVSDLLRRRLLDAQTQEMIALA